MRLHPAESRIKRLSAEIPADYVAFDILVWKGEPLHELPLKKRRRELERKAKRFRLSPAELDPKQAKRWLERLDQAGLDGVVAKRLEQPYLPGSREAVVKVKPYRTADCVIVGFRWSDKADGRISTLLLGLYSDNGELDFVGHCSGFPAPVRRELEEAKVSGARAHEKLSSAIVALGGAEESWRDLKKKEEELEVLKAYVPAAMSEEDVEAEVAAVIADLKPEGPKGFGLVMKTATSAVVSCPLDTSRVTA